MNANPLLKNNRRRLAMAAATVIVSAGAVAFGMAGHFPRGMRSATGPTSADSARAMAPGTSGGTTLPTALPLPPILQDSTAPRLPLMDGGRLGKTRAVRDFFDYFLTARSQMSDTALDALVRRAIAAQLDGTSAAIEANDVWHRYRIYLDELNRLPGPPATTSGTLDLPALRTALDARAALASRSLGEWYPPFFGDELDRQRRDLERLRIASDKTLSDEERSARMAALDQMLPPEERALRERTRQRQIQMDTLTALQRQQLSPDVMRAQVAQTLSADPDAAARVVDMENAEAAWQRKYANYAAQRARLDQPGLAQLDRDAQLARLRQQFFPAAEDAARAASLDPSSGE